MFKKESKFFLITIDSLNTSFREPTPMQFTRNLRKSDNYYNFFMITQLLLRLRRSSTTHRYLYTLFFFISRIRSIVFEISNKNKHSVQLQFSVLGCGPVKKCVLCHGKLPENLILKCQNKYNLKFSPLFSQSKTQSCAGNICKRKIHGNL